MNIVMKEEQIKKAYADAKEHYAALGIDVDKAIEKLNGIPISIHCWQPGRCFGIRKPGRRTYRRNPSYRNYPGKARTIEELRKDIEKVLSLVPENTG